MHQYYHPKFSEVPKSKSHLALRDADKGVGLASIQGPGHVSQLVTGAATPYTMTDGGPTKILVEGLPWWHND